MKTKVINLYGAPGAGKSTGAAYIFCKLKLAGVECELVREYAKELVWAESEEIENQADIFSEQLFRQAILEKKVQYIITDSPLLLSIIYNSNPYLEISGFYEEVEDVYNYFENINYFVNRTKQFNPNGRVQDSPEESDKIANKIKGLLDDKGISYSEIDGTVDGYDVIVRDILEEAKKC